MWFVADVHGAAQAMRRLVDRLDGPLVVLGDLINLVDYRTLDGIAAEVSGRDLVARFVALRSEGRFDAASELWRAHARGREEELRRRYDAAIELAYEEICAALVGAEAYVTYGNVDHPARLAERLPATARFVDAEVLELEGHTVGIVGGGLPSIGSPGEISDDEMADKLRRIGPVEILGTHVPPAVPALARDVIGGRQKGSEPLADYLVDARPAYHYFGDIHQPQATTWRVGGTRCVNVGYFRATGRAVRHGG